jgi:hypothetical protein
MAVLECFLEKTPLSPLGVKNPTPKVQFQPHIEFGELLVSLGFGLCHRGNDFALEVEMTHWSGMTLNYISQEVPSEFILMG